MSSLSGNLCTALLTDKGHSYFNLHSYEKRTAIVKMLNLTIQFPIKKSHVKEYLLSSESSSELDCFFFATTAGFAGVLAGVLATTLAFESLSSSDDSESLDSAFFFCTTGDFAVTALPEDFVGTEILNVCDSFIQRKEEMRQKLHHFLI